MVVLEIDNSYSIIKGLDAQNFSKLSKLLSYSLNTGFSNNPKFRRRKSLLDKKGSFPTGLLSYVQDFLLNTPHTVVDARKSMPKLGIHKYKLHLLKPYPWQLKAMSAVKKHSRGGIVAPTGTGKSLLMELITSYYGVKTLIVVPTVEIRDQLRKQFWGVWRKEDVAIENIDSTALQRMTDYNLLLIDECHRAAAKTYQKLNKTAWNNIKHRYFFSATYFRNNDNENLLLESIVGKPLFELSYLDAIINNYIVPVEAYYIQVPKTKTGGFTWHEVYKDLVTNNAIRNEKIKDLLCALKGKSTLCLVKEIEHGNNLTDNGYFVSGEDPNCRLLIKKFNLGLHDQLIATTGIMGEGVDTKPCEYVIYAGLGKARSSFMQAVGRAVRIYPGKRSAKVIIFKDDSHKWTKRHFREQCKILLEEYGVKAVELKI